MGEFVLPGQAMNSRADVPLNRQVVLRVGVLVSMAAGIAFLLLVNAEDVVSLQKPARLQTPFLTHVEAGSFDVENVRMKRGFRVQSVAARTLRKRSAVSRFHVGVDSK